MQKIIYSIIFFILTALMLFVVANTLRDRETTLAAMYSEPDNTIDVAIVGSSHVNNGYIPNILWENNNLSACNVFSWSQPMWTSYHYIKETLKTQSPQIIVLEMYGMMYGHSYIQPQEIDKTNYATNFNIDIGLNFFQLIQTAENVGIELTPYEEFLNLPRYHTRWKLLNEKMFTYSPHNDNDFLKGYGITFGIEPFENVDIKSENISEPYEFSIEYLDKIVELCEKEQIELIFTMVPYVYTEKEVEIYNWIENYSNEKGIEFFNYNTTDKDRIGFDFSTDLSNMGHLNYSGALKITQDLSDILTNYLNKEKTENNNFENLNSDYNKYTRVIEANDIMTETDINEYLKLGLSDDNYSLFIINNGVTLHEDIFELFNNFGIEIPNNKNTFTISTNINGEHLIDTLELTFNLFNEDGNITYIYNEQNADVLLNGVKVISNDSNFKIVLYDNILQRPLETVVLNGDSLEHKEFTSDIINLFKK